MWDSGNPITVYIITALGYTMCDALFYGVY